MGRTRNVTSFPPQSLWTVRTPLASGRPRHRLRHHPVLDPLALVPRYPGGRLLSDQGDP